MGALGALLAADVGMWSDGGGKRPAAMEPVLGYDIVLKLHRSLAVLFGKYGSTLVHTGMINGLPGFVTREADGELQTTALEIDDGRSEEHTSELQSLMRLSYAVLCLQTQKNTTQQSNHYQ